MNLHSVVSGIIGAVNPPILATIRVSTGPGATQPSGKRIPTFAPDVTRMVQAQPMTYKDIQQTDGLNLQGTRISIYVTGVVQGLVRATNHGGDLIIISSGPYAGTWLVAMVLEQWPDWCKVAATLQNGN